MEDVLAKQPFLAGNDYSLADVIWSAILGRLEFIKKLDWIEERPHLARYYQHLKSRPSWESAVMWPQWRYGKMAVTVWSALGPYILMAIGIVLAVTIALSMDTWSFVVPLPRWERLAEDRKASILRAALVEIGEHGLVGASTHRIIKEAKISKASFYHYFDGKTDLAKTAIFHLMNSLTGSLELPLPSTSQEFWATVHLAVSQASHWFLSHPVELLAMQELAQSSHPSQIPAGFEEIQQNVAKQLAQILHTGIQLGAVRDDLDPAYLLQVVVAVALVSDRWLLTLASRGDEAIHQHVVVVVDLYRRIVAPPQNEESPTSDR